MANNNSIKVITGKVRFSYVHVFEPVDNFGTGKAKYSASIIIPKNDVKTVNNIKAAINQIANENSKDLILNGKLNPRAKICLRDGDVDRPEDPNYADSYFMNAVSDVKPEIINIYKMPITSSEEFYSGCYGKASVNLFFYNHNNNKGIGCGLRNILKTEDGERLGGKSSAASDFADEEEIADLGSAGDDILNAII